MNWLQFIAALIDSVAWPTAIVVLVIVLRTQIRSLLATLTSLKYKGLELDFGRELKKVEAAAKDVIEVGPPRPLERKVTLRS